MKQIYSRTTSFPCPTIYRPSQLRHDSRKHIEEVSTTVCNELAGMGYNKEASNVYLFLERVRDDIRLATTHDFNRTLALDFGSLKAKFEILIRFDKTTSSRVYEINVGY